MPDGEDIRAQQELLEAHRRTLAVYLKQRAIHSEAYTPPAVEQGIDEARRQIRAIKNTLRGWGVQVADHPDDEEYHLQQGGARRLLGRALGLLGMLTFLSGFGLFIYVVGMFFVGIGDLAATPPRPPRWAGGLLRARAVAPDTDRHGPRLRRGRDRGVRRGAERRALDPPVALARLRWCGSPAGCASTTNEPHNDNRGWHCRQNLLSERLEVPVEVLLKRLSVRLFVGMERRHDLLTVAR